MGRVESTGHREFSSRTAGRGLVLPEVAVSCLRAFWVPGGLRSPCTLKVTWSLVLAGEPTVLSAPTRLGAGSLGSRWRRVHLLSCIASSTRLGSALCAHFDVVTVRVESLLDRCSVEMLLVFGSWPP